jgi:hypothetical protein
MQPARARGAPRHRPQEGWCFLAGEHAQGRNCDAWVGEGSDKLTDFESVAELSLTLVSFEGE